jgi:hypothetical protein
MKTFLFVIEGLTPLLMHRFGDAEEMEANTRKVHVKAQDPRQAAEKAAYRNAAGELFVPGAAIARMLREAAAAHKQRGSRKSMKYVVPAAVLVPDDQLVLRNCEGKALTDFEVDSRPVVIPSTKGRVMRHRPRLNAWNLEGALQIDDELIEPSLVHQFLVEGTAKLGLLDYRPEKGGPFGKSAVVSWAELTQTIEVKLAAD